MIPRCASVSGRPPRPPSGPPPAHGARIRCLDRTRHPVPNSHAQGHGWRRWPAIGVGVPGQGVERRPEHMHGAARPHRLGPQLREGPREPGVVVGDDALGAGPAAAREAGQDARPVRP